MERKHEPQCVQSPEGRRPYSTTPRWRNPVPSPRMSVAIKRTVDLKALAMRVGDVTNVRYEDLSAATWDDARAVLQAEHELLDSGFDPSDDDDGLAVSEFSEVAFGLDPGVASSVLALCAAGCRTYSSCNGWPRHDEDYALVAFRCSPKLVPKLLDLAEIAACGLENGYPGLLLLYANDVKDLMRFAGELISRSAKPV